MALAERLLGASLVVLPSGAGVVEVALWSSLSSPSESSSLAGFFVLSSAALLPGFPVVPLGLPVVVLADGAPVVVVLLPPSSALGFVLEPGGDDAADVVASAAAEAPVVVTGFGPPWRPLCLRPALAVVALGAVEAGAAVDPEPA